MKKTILLILTLLILSNPIVAEAKYNPPDPIAYKLSQRPIIVVEEPEPTPVEMTDEVVEETDYYDSLELLAICVEAEAGNQGLRGKRLVADVILNRVDSSRFPNNITDVIAEKNQFSSYNNGAMNKVYEPSKETFKAVKMELKERLDTQILFFTAGGYNSYCTPAYKYNDHYFGY